jgi:hypothetical protein
LFVYVEEIHEDEVLKNMDEVIQLLILEQMNAERVIVTDEIFVERENVVDRLLVNEYLIGNMVIRMVIYKVVAMVVSLVLHVAQMIVLNIYDVHMVLD